MHSGTLTKDDPQEVSVEVPGRLFVVRVNFDKIVDIVVKMSGERNDQRLCRWAWYFDFRALNSPTWWVSVDQSMELDHGLSAMRIFVIPSMV